MKKVYIYVALPVIALTLFGANLVAAHGLGHGWEFGGGFGTMAAPDQIASRQQAMFQDGATFLGISTEAVKAGWAQGKNLSEIAADNGITADQLKTKMQAARTAQVKSHLQSLVDKGVITQAQADQRAAWLATQLNTRKFMRHGRGLMHFPKL